MSDEKFDELSKALAKATSRRQALKILGATTAGGALALFGARAAGGAPGRCRKNGTTCRQDYECCSFYCDPGTGRCKCPPGSHLCPKGPGRPTERCVFCGRFQELDPETCECKCVQGTTACGEFECCVTGQETCCSSTYYGYEFFFCCPPGTSCVEGECVA